MPKLKAVVDKLDSVPEAYRDLYTERDDGKFILDADGVEDVAGLRSTLQSKQKRADELARKLAEFGELTPEKAKELLAGAEEAERKKAESKGEWEKLKVSLVEAHTKALKAKDDEINDLMAEIRLQVGENAARKAIESVSESVDLLIPHVMRRVKVDRGEDRRFRAQVLDANGQPMIGADGNPVKIESLLEELKKDPKFQPAFKGTGSSGSGAEGGTRGGTGGQPYMISHADAKIPAKYRAAKEAAQKAGVEMQYTD